VAPVAVNVTGPCESTPSVTPPPTPSATVPPIPTSTATAIRITPATPTPTATPTATPRPVPVYLPLALREQCVPGQQRVDVALVIDASTSMVLERTRQGRTKLDAAVEAVELFVGDLDLPQDQAAIVSFNAGAELLQPLTGDRAALADALTRIQVQQTTRLDLGIQVARTELSSTRRKAGNDPVMIVLTDGRANPVGPDAAVREGAAAKGEGVTIFTIGLGEELDLDALSAIASKPAYFYSAPDGEDLEAIYKAIAVAIPCPADTFWGRR
jgi:Mg-chelatase subunit ChlD